MAGRSDAELDALVEQAIVDAYDEYEQLASLSRSALAGSIGRRSASWICRCLENHVRGLVDRVAGSVERVIQTAASTWGVDKEVLCRSAGRRCDSGEPATTERRLGTASLPPTRTDRFL